LRGDATPVFQATGLGVRFGGFQALEDVSWSAHAGRILGIIGPNGAGKSTCFQAATNMVKHAGRLVLDGRDITKIQPNHLPGMGLRRTFQQNAFFSGMTVLQNMVGVLGRGRRASFATSVFAPWLEIAGRRRLEAEARAHLLQYTVPSSSHDQLPAELPYGTQRMLSIALACADGARVVLLDEPGAGLGGADMEALAALLRRLRADGVAVVLIEHHMDLVMGIADEIVVIEQGRMLAHGPPRAIQADPRVMEAYLGRAA
jgi:branched-chain amino acid transport system ATP-binding protein